MKLAFCASVVNFLLFLVYRFCSFDSFIALHIICVFF